MDISITYVLHEVHNSQFNSQFNFQFNSFFNFVNSVNFKYIQYAKVELKLYSESESKVEVPRVVFVDGAEVAAVVKVIADAGL